MRVGIEAASKAADPEITYDGREVLQNGGAICSLEDNILECIFLATLSGGR